MSRRMGGARAGTRRLFCKNPRQKGKISITKFFMPYKIGDRAVLSAEPAIQWNLYHQRFHGKAGTVIGKRGDCYEITIKDGGKEKMVIVHPVHLKKV